MFRRTVLSTLLVFVVAPSAVPGGVDATHAGTPSAATSTAASPNRGAARRVAPTSPSVEPPRSDVPTAPSVTVRPDDAAHRARVRDAVRRYEAAGLDLPSVRVEFSDDGCFGNLGVFDRNTQPWTVHVCSNLEFVLTHELGHAWVAATLDQADRDAYVEFRELPAWSDPELHWRERGTEDAAFVLQRVLMTEHPRRDLPAWQELSTAYEQLTGGPPPQHVTVESPRTGSSHETTRGTFGRTRGGSAFATLWQWTTSRSSLAIPSGSRP